MYTKIQQSSLKFHVRYFKKRLRLTANKGSSTISNSTRQIPAKIKISPTDPENQSDIRPSRFVQIGNICSRYQFVNPLEFHAIMSTAVITRIKNKIHRCCVIRSFFEIFHVFIFRLLSTTMDLYRKIDKNFLILHQKLYHITILLSIVAYTELPCQFLLFNRIKQFGNRIECGLLDTKRTDTATISLICSGIRSPEILSGFLNSCQIIKLITKNYLIV